MFLIIVSTPNLKLTSLINDFSVCFQQVSLLQLASSRVDSYGGWNEAPDTQYHIQTDEGEERYFKYQTKTGQYRKEKRLQDGQYISN